MDADNPAMFNFHRLDVYRCALECAAIVDALEALGGAAATELAQPRELLERIVSMLTRMSKE